ncbi:MAG: DUF1573 domain-containing protein [Acidobacteriia bacterium]|nr:DUF1573 domain-containing protein [Terriglobia bacterium]
MRREILGVVAAVLIAGVASALPQAAPAQNPVPRKPVVKKTPEGPQPAIEIVEKIKDFGVVAKGDKIHAIFEVRNTGKAPLEISQVRPTCGCTVANFDRTVAPGEGGKIVAEVDTTGFNGAISKAVLVFSNDPATPQVSLVIKAEVRAFVEVLPRPLVIFQSVLQGEAATQKLTLSSTDGSDFKIESAIPSGGPYEISYRELPTEERIPDKKGSQWGLTVTVPANAPEGMLNHKILVKTTAPKAREVTINVTGAVRPVVQVIPGEVNFGTVAGDALIGRNVMINNNRQGTELKLTDVSVDNPNFTTEVLPLQAGQRFQVAVTMKAGVPKGTQKATLKITTNDPMRKSIEVPIQAVVQ